MLNEPFTMRVPVGLTSVVLILLIALLVLVLKDLAARVARWIADQIVAGLDHLLERTAARANLIRQAMRRVIFRSGGRVTPRRGSSNAAMVIARVIVGRLRYVAGHPDDPVRQRHLAHGVDEINAAANRGIRDVVATGTGALVGVIQLRARKDLTVVVAVEFGFVALVLLAIGILETLVHGRFGPAALATGVVLLGLSHALANPARAGLVIASLGLLGPAGFAATWFSPTMETTVVMLVASVAATWGGVEALRARALGVRSLEACDQPPGALHAVAMAVRLCSISTLLFCVANLLQAILAPTVLLRVSYMINALGLLGISYTTARSPLATSYGAMVE